jgi:hypothetical protein
VVVCFWLGGVGTKKLNIIYVTREEKIRRGSEDTRARGERERERSTIEVRLNCSTTFS